MQPFSIYRGHIMKVERNFLSRPVVIGQGATFINLNRVDIDWG